MNVEEHIARELDRLYPNPVPYIGRPVVDAKQPTAREMEKMAAEDRRIKAQARIEAEARRDFELSRKRQISASQPDAMTILSAVACAHGITLSALLSKNKCDKVARARHHAVWQLYQRKPTMSSPQIGNLLKRDSSTIRVSYEVFQETRHLYEERIQIVARMLAQ